MRLENLIQFIVPLTFMAIWAITSLLNREAQPPPPRAGRPQRPNGAGQPVRYGEAPTRSATTTQPGGPRREPDPRSPAVRRDARPAETGRRDDIVILEEDSRRPPETRQAPRTSRSRSSNREKARQTPQAEKAPSRRSTIEGVTNLSEGTHAVPSQALTPLSLTETLGISGTILVDTVAYGAGMRGERALSAFGLDLTPETLRQSFLVAEVLFRPPITLRGNGPLVLGKARPAPTSPHDGTLDEKW